MISTTFELRRRFMRPESCVSLEQIDDVQKDAIRSARALKTLFSSNTLCDLSGRAPGEDGWVTGEKILLELCATDIGFMIRSREIYGGEGSSNRPYAVLAEWCCFLDHDIKRPSKITEDNWGDFTQDGANSTIILIRYQSETGYPTMRDVHTLF